MTTAFHFSRVLIKMQITKEGLLGNKARLEDEIRQHQQDLVAKDGALQMIEGLLALLEKEETKNADL